MATKIGEAYYDITARTGKLEAELAKVQKKMDTQVSKQGSLIGSLKTGYLVAAAGVAVFAAAIVKSVNAASRLAEQTSKFNTVFGPNVEAANKSVENLITNYAMSTREARQYMAAMQDLLVPMGMNSQLAAQYSDELVRLAADMGSFNDQPTADVMMDIQSALVGNYETMKKYGVVLNETLVNHEAVRMGLAKHGDTLSQVNKVQAAYSLVLKGTAAAQGDMMRTGDSWANVQKKIGATIENTFAAFGSEIIPALSNMYNALMDAAGGTESLTNAFKQFGADVGRIINSVTSGILEMSKKAAQIEVVWAKLAGNDADVTRAEEAVARIDNAINNHLIRTGKAFRYVREEAGATVEVITESSVAPEGFVKAAEQAATSGEKFGGVLKNLQKDANIAGGGIKNVGSELDKLSKDMEEGVKKEVQDLVESIATWSQTITSGFSTVGTTIGQIFSQINQNQISELENAQNLQMQFLDLWKTSALAAAGFIEDTEAQKNKKSIAALKEKLKQETSERKKAAIQRELDEQLRLQKKYEIERQHETAKFVFEQVMERKKSQLRRQGAIIQRAMAIFNATTSAIQATVQAFAAYVGIPYVGLATGAAAAAVTAAFEWANVGALAAIPIPVAAKGGVSKGPYIGGEAGREMAVPLESSSGRSAIRLFASQLMDEIESRSAPDTRGTITGPGGDNLFHVVVNVGGKKLYDDITRATRDGQILIHARAVV